MNSEKTLVFTYDGHETRNTLRYHEINDKGERVELAESTIGTLYLRKKALNGARPARLQVTVSADQ
jgi:hypothetical protein